jgi:hypothetical protein
MFSKTFDNQHKKGEKQRRHPLTQAALKALELIRINNISDHL